MDPIKAVIIHLTGSDDAALCLIPQLAYDWAMSREADNSKSQAFPGDVLEALKPFCDPAAEEEYDELIEDGVVVTTGSGHNDIMLALSAVVSGYNSTSEILRTLKEKGWELSEDEYYGMIY